VTNDILFKQHSKTRDICLQNARDLITSAKRLVNSNLQHIQYHLSALALEEIGKAELIEMSFIAGINSRDTTYEENSIENHVRKLYMAFWGPSFGKKVITKQEIEQLQGLASSIHFRRLDTLYVKPTDQNHPKTKLAQKEADQILSLAEARLGMEETKTMLKPDDPSINKEELQWFLTANSDPEKFKLIFGKKSQEKLIEIGNVRDWIHWLKEQFDQNDAEIRRIVEEEVKRQKPTGKDAKKPKYKVRIRINSESHSVRTKELKKWNEHMDFIKLYSDDKRDLIIDLFLQKSVHIQGTWFLGWGMVRTFVTALNIATKGFFWWHVPKDRSRYYEDMWDLERNMRMGTQQNPELTVNFKDLHWVLRDSDLGRTSMIFYYITKVRDKPEGRPLNDYVIGLSFLAKNDIHLRFELNCYDQFYKAFRSAFLISGDWDGKTDFKEAVHKQFDKLSKFNDLNEVIDLGEEQQNSPTKSTKNPITLTEVFAVKLFCDIYFEMLARRAVDSWKKERKTESGVKVRKP
jgi:AbiV family abortive infection protein